MKPLFLNMTAFGPFADRVAVNFAPAINGRLFLISGRTGAGKTTLLDALCFALFGKSSSAERDKDLRALRSDHAAEDCATSVELLF